MGLLNNIAELASALVAYVELKFLKRRLDKHAAEHDGEDKACMYCLLQKEHMASYLRGVTDGNGLVIVRPLAKTKGELN